MMKQILIILGLLLLIAFGYYLFYLNDGQLVTSNAMVNSRAEQETQNFLRLLNVIGAIDLQTEVLSDPRFTNRVDNSQPVPVVPVGRDNPFVPSN